MILVFLLITLVVQVQQSVGCVCVWIRTVSFELDYPCVR